MYKYSFFIFFYLNSSIFLLRKLDNGNMIFYGLQEKFKIFNKSIRLSAGEDNLPLKKVFNSLSKKDYLFIKFGLSENNLITLKKDNEILYLAKFEYIEHDKDDVESYKIEVKFLRGNKKSFCSDFEKIFLQNFFFKEKRNFLKPEANINLNFIPLRIEKFNFKKLIEKIDTTIFNSNEVFYSDFAEKSLPKERISIEKYIKSFEDYEKEMKLKDKDFLIILSSGKEILGQGKFLFNKEKCSCYIKAISVNDFYIGYGLGTKIVGNIIYFCKKNGITSIDLESYNSSCFLYENFGFEKKGNFKNDLVPMSLKIQ